MRLVRPIAFLLAACACACARQPARAPVVPASPPAQAHTRHTGIDYSRYVTGTVGMFSFSSLYDWDSNDPTHVVVWTTPFEAYRLTLLSPCFQLQYAPIIALTSHGGTVTSGFDDVLVRGDRCRIENIQKLDAKAIRAARKQKRD